MISRRVTLPSVDSTNEEARRRAAAGEAGPLWILGLRQTAGRGRRGRAWTAPEGALSATLLMRPATDPARAALMSFAACLAVAETAEALIPGATATCKWPNDVLVEGRKISGVLLEGEGAGRGLAWLAVGIGINLAAAPPADPAAAHPPGALAELGAGPVAPEAALDLLAPRFEHHAETLLAEGFAPLRRLFLSRAARIGREVEARLPGRTVTGVFADLDAEGRLVLHTPTGTERISAADVHFPARAAPA